MYTGGPLKRQVTGEQCDYRATQLILGKWRNLLQLLNIIAREKLINIHLNVFLKGSCLEPQLLGCLKKHKGATINAFLKDEKKSFIFNVQAFE
jgi:hypothetical protein